MAVHLVGQTELVWVLSQVAMAGIPPGMRDVRAAAELLKPYDARLMRCYPVSSRINHVANDDEACSTRVELAQMQNP